MDMENWWEMSITGRLKGGTKAQGHPGTGSLRARKASAPSKAHGTLCDGRKCRTYGLRSGCGRLGGMSFIQETEAVPTPCNSPGYFQFHILYSL